MFGIVKNFIPKNYFDDLRNEIDLKQDNIVVGGKVIKEERATAWMSDFNFQYKYGDKVMEPDKLSKSVKEIQKIINENYGVYYDSALINYYKNGNVGMRYHSDETYNEWCQDTVIVSFGETRQLVFREIKDYNNKTYYEINSGDIIYMKEGCQDLYQHRVLKNKNINKGRISLVFKKKLF